MAVVIVKNKVSKKDLKQAQEEYSEYVKIVADINIRPSLGNDSQEILNPNTRQRVVDIVKEKFRL